MANVLGELFQDIANAIRGKTGDTGTMKPAQFPDAISGIEVGSGGDTSDIDDLLDEINGEVIGETLYYVTFIGVDGEELCQVPVYEQDDCADPVTNGDISEPTKESTKYYSYPFAGWSLTDGGEADDNALLCVTSNRTVYAAFEAKKIYLASGDCGNSISTIIWTIDPDYILELAGSGSTGSYFDSDNADATVPPWNAYKTQIKSLVVGEGITSIGMYNFDGCTALASVEFSSTVRQLGHYSFRGCTALASIAFSEAIKYIYQYAFYNCTALTNAIFERTAGWTAEPSGSGDSISLSESIISDATVVAQYLTDTYVHYNWVNSDAA